MFCTQLRTQFCTNGFILSYNVYFNFYSRRIEFSTWLFVASTSKFSFSQKYLSLMISEANSGGPRTNIEMHSLNPRISFDITTTDAASDVVPVSLHDRSHVVISLMQDYRQGTRTSNSMLLAIGFCVYRVSPKFYFYFIIYMLF